MGREVEVLEGRTLWELLDGRVAATPEGVMAVDDVGRTMTFAELRTAAERCAAGLAQRGIGAGDVVSWQLPTWFESMVLVVALSRLGAVQNPLLPIYREKEVGFVCSQAEAKLLITPSEWRGFDFGAMARGLAESRPGLETLVIDRDPQGNSLPDGDPSTLPARSPDLDNPDQPVRWLFYTSGTTADPKGAQHTDGNIAAVGAGMSERMELGPEDRNSMVFPFTHIGGITWLFASLQSGCGNIFLEAFHPEDTPRALTEHGCTVAGAGTIFHQTYLAYANAHPDEEVLGSVRVFAGGGAPKPPALVGEILDRFGAPILSGYGLTEAPILTMAGTADTPDELARSEGKPMPGVELKLVALDGSAAEPGQEGEIRAKAPQVMRGYLDSSLDVEAFDEDGFFRTGDLGRLDEKGNVVITGRLKDIIIRKGENVSAKEVEDALYTHPGVADAAVIGLPDAASGERVCAVLQAAVGAELLDVSGVRDFLVGTGLMVQKCPEQVEYVEVIPRNPSGKVLKHVLRAQYADGS